MENQLDKISLLDKNGRFSCVVCQGDDVIYTSVETGVKPLKIFYETKGSLNNLTVIDRVMGKGAVILADLVGASSIVTPVISQRALEYANSKNLNVSYLKVVEYIINRTKDGQCPIEEATIKVTDSQEGYHIICETLKKLQGIGWFDAIS